ncbi:MAG: hypothetical protein I8H71_05865 [Xanthomonadaceae bacterium]|nr:hypothetical protein [Xanthomonadaceae bacterium]
MKSIATLFASALLIAGGNAGASGNHGDHSPMHGGMVVEGKQADFELVAKPEVLQLYLRDHGKAISAAKASAKVTLLSGSDKQEVTLAPAGDRLEAKGNFQIAAGTKVVAVVTNDGKSLGTARFTLK